ncbi:MAG: AAA family ATPase [Nitrospirae bacterium]|nr:AAA family ATPase [Nitrospirota bacterium]
MSRVRVEAGYAEHLSTEGENLSLVTEYLYTRHRKDFDEILEKLSHRVPGISNVEAKTTEEGRVLLRFRDGAFEDPFLARYVSDGTIKMFAYLVMLYDPNPFPLLCVEEPENQFYPKLLTKQRKGKFRNPDSLGNPLQEIGKLTAGRYQKVSGSRLLGPFLSINGNRSHSFKVFISGIEGLVLNWNSNRGSLDSVSPGIQARSPENHH